MRWFNEGPRRNWPAPVRAIAAHFYVVSIHPFGDGNGRTARAVESFLLYRGGINARGFYSLANYYYRFRHRDVALLDSVRFSSDHDLTPFVRFALDGLLGELEDVHGEVLAQVRHHGLYRSCQGGPGVARKTGYKRRTENTQSPGCLDGETCFAYCPPEGPAPLIPFL